MPICHSLPPYALDMASNGDLEGICDIEAETWTGVERTITRVLER